MKKRTVLFICSGNTCRSPMAAEYFKQVLLKTKYDNIEVLSAGTNAQNGIPASENAKKIASEFNFDLSAHLSKSLSQELITKADLLIAMTKTQITTAMRISQKTSPEKFKLLLSFLPNSMECEVSDPFGGDIEIYRKCFLQMKPALDNLLIHF